MRNAIGVEKIHSDATYKLVWNGFPVLLIGTTDSYRSFHIFGLAVCTNETETDFRFIFESFKNGLAEKFNVKLEPKYLIADAAKSIHNAFKHVFGEDTTVITCWFHMKKAVKGNLFELVRNTSLTYHKKIWFLDHLEKAITDKKKQTSFWNDLDKLQSSKRNKSSIRLSFSLWPNGKRSPVASLHISKLNGSLKIPIGMKQLPKMCQAQIMLWKRSIEQLKTNRHCGIKLN